MIFGAAILAAEHPIAPSQSLRAYDSAQKEERTRQADQADTRPFRMQIQAELHRMQIQAEFQEFLKIQHDRIATITAPILAGAEAVNRLEDELKNQQIAILTAQSKFDQAKAEREVAEIAVREYQDRIAIQDQKLAESKIKQARSDLENARHETAEAEERLARITASHGSVRLRCQPGLRLYRSGENGQAPGTDR